MKEVEYSDLNEGLFDFFKSSESVMKQICDEILQEGKRMIVIEYEKRKEAEFANRTFAEMRQVNRRAIENINAFAEEKQKDLPVDKKLQSKKEKISAYREDFREKVEKAYIDFSEYNKRAIEEIERQFSREIEDHEKKLSLLFNSAKVKIAGNDSRLKYYNSRRATERGILTDYRLEKAQEMRDLLRLTTLDKIFSVYSGLQSLYEEFENHVSDMESDYKKKITEVTVLPPDEATSGGGTETTGSDTRLGPAPRGDDEDDPEIADFFGGPRVIDTEISNSGTDDRYPKNFSGTDPFKGKPYKLKLWEGEDKDGTYHFLYYEDKSPKVFFLLEIEDKGIEIPFYFEKFDNAPEGYPPINNYVFLPCFGMKGTGKFLEPVSLGDFRKPDENKESKFRYNYHKRTMPKKTDRNSREVNFSLKIIDTQENGEVLRKVSEFLDKIRQTFIDNRFRKIEKTKSGKTLGKNPRNIQFYKNSPQYNAFSGVYSEPNEQVIDMVNGAIQKILDKVIGGVAVEDFDYLLNNKPDDTFEEKKEYNKKFDYVLSTYYLVIANALGYISDDSIKKSDPAETVVDEEEIEGEEIEKEDEDDSSTEEPVITPKPDTSSTPPASTTPSSDSGGGGEKSSDVEPLPFGALYKGKYYTYKYATHSKEGYPILYYGEKGTINDNDQKKNQIIIGTEVEKTLNINVLYNDKEEKVRIEPEKIRSSIEDEKLRVKKTGNYKHRIKGYEPYFIALGYSYGDEKEVTDEVVIPLIKVKKIAVLIGSSSFLIDGKPVVAGDRFYVDGFNYTILSFVKDKVRVKAKNEETKEEKEVSYALKDLDDLLKSAKRIASTPKRQKSLPGIEPGDKWEKKTDDVHLIYTFKHYNEKTGHPIFFIEDKEDGTEKEKTIKREDFLFDINNNYIKKIEEIDIKVGDLYMTTNLPFKRYEIVSVDLPNKQISYTSTAFGSNKKQKKTENIADFKRKIEAGNIKFTSSKEMVITEKNTFFKMEDLNLQDGDRVSFYDGKNERRGTYVKGKDFSGIEEGEDFWDIEEEIFANDGSYIVNMSGIERDKSDKPSSKKTTIDDSLKDKPAFEVSAKDEWKETSTGKKWIITGVTDKNVTYRVAGTKKINTVPLSRFEKLYKTGKISLVRKSKKQKAGVTNESFFTQIHTKQETNYMKKVKNFQEFTSVNEGFAEWLGGTIRRGVDQALNTTSGKLKNLTAEISAKMEEYLELYEEYAKDYLSTMEKHKKSPNDTVIEVDLEQSRSALLGLQKRYNELLRGFNERAAELYIDKKGKENVELKNAYNQWMAIEEQKIRKIQNAVRARIEARKQTHYNPLIIAPVIIPKNIESYINMSLSDYSDAIQSLTLKEIPDFLNDLEKYSTNLKDKLSNIPQKTPKENKNVTDTRTKLNNAINDVKQKSNMLSKKLRGQSSSRYYNLGI